MLACAVHGACTVSKRVGAVACCDGCPDYAKYPPVETRNLIYHLCPLSDNDGWRQNVRQLVKRWGVFNGRRIIAVARGKSMEPMSEIYKELGRRECEILKFDNDPQLREVATFLPLLEVVKNASGATFYAHTKGNSTAADARGAIRWRNAMYLHLLERDLERSMRELRRRVFVGCHKMVWGQRKPPYPSGLSHGTWFLAGTFFWFRNDVVFSSDKWRDVPRDRYGAEAWPAGIVDYWEAASVYQKFPEHQTYTVIDNPYNPALYDGENLDDPC